ncbi:HTH-type transcriptional repressor NemR [Marinobacter litoralis]|uniref:HTH-type transcriptional repressor NemR n=1 Tax=Marinobacter litoralis TaxID=187981 RepID=A0A3M2RCR4_9GAMM|nr:TetR/AcrR family transcriptional regulator [Marinobacter litoralis]RMJ03086.1 HTH-type transcriptional repressor NemR [Marinobacter litoralis]
MEPKVATQDVRSHILETAQVIISGKGFSAVGLNQILQAAGVPKGSFYHYFGSKEAFGEELLKSYFADYHETLDAMLSRPGLNGAERLISYWQTWLETQSACDPKGKCLTVKLAAEVSDLSETMRAVLARETSRVVARLEQAVAEGIEDGSLPATLNAKVTASTLYQLWLGASLRSKITRDPEPMECALTATKEMLGL